MQPAHNISTIKTNGNNKERNPTNNQQDKKTTELPFCGIEFGAMASQIHSLFLGWLLSMKLPTNRKF